MPCIIRNLLIDAYNYAAKCVEVIYYDKVEEGQSGVEVGPVVEPVLGEFVTIGRAQDH